MLKSYKTEINPTDEQKHIINKTIGTCRFVYNFYLNKNKELYEQDKSFMTAFTFVTWMNNEFLPNNPEYKWIKEVSSISVIRSIRNAEMAYKRFFKKQSGFPKFKSKKDNDVKMYFVRSGKDSAINCERHRIKIPTLGWVRIKEKGYIPTNPDTHIIKSGTVSYKAGRYYVSVLVEEDDKTDFPVLENEGLGIDLGVIDFITCSNGLVKENINKSEKIRKLEKKLKRENRSLSRKYEAQKKENRDTPSNNFNKEKLKIEKIHQTITNIRTDYMNKCIDEIIDLHPSYVTLERLDIEKMLKNKYLSKSIIDSCFYEFKIKLINKCKENGIEVREVDQFYPSTKTCHVCGKVNKDFNGIHRTFKCEYCGYIGKRTYNSSMNLKNAIDYKIIT